MTPTKPRECWLDIYKTNPLESDTRVFLNDPAKRKIYLNKETVDRIHYVEASAILAKDEELEALKEKFGYTYCAYCNEKFEVDRPDLTKAVGAHILDCKKHPTNALAEKAKKLQSENARLRELLENYGSHKFHCDENQGTEGECTCGFLKALSGGEV